MRYTTKKVSIGHRFEILFPIIIYLLIYNHFILIIICVPPSTLTIQVYRQFNMNIFAINSSYMYTTNCFVKPLYRQTHKKYPLHISHKFLTKGHFFIFIPEKKIHLSNREKTYTHSHGRTYHYNKMEKHCVSAFYCHFPFRQMGWL